MNPTLTTTADPAKPIHAGKLNLGCGELPLAGYLNIDTHGTPDVKGDIRRLAFTGVQEARMIHALEHIPFRDVVPLLARIRSWMEPDALLVVEVPDMAAIMRTGDGDQWWLQYIYGSQAHEGEFHRSGFTFASLEDALLQAGYQRVEVRAFKSTHPYRLGMPCLEAQAYA